MSTMPSLPLSFPLSLSLALSLSLSLQLICVQHLGNKLSIRSQYVQPTPLLFRRVV